MRSLRRLVPYYQPYRRQAVLGLLLVIGSAALSALLPWLVRTAVDGLATGVPIVRLWQIAAAMVALALASGGARYWMREILNGISRRIEFDLRNDLFTHLESLDAPYFSHSRTGDIMARLTNDLSAVRMAAGPAIMYLVNTVAGGLFALVFMLQISGRLTLLALLPVVLLPIVTARMGSAIHVRFEAVQEHFASLTTLAQENLAGVRIVRAYRQEAAEEERFGGLNAEYLERNMRLVRLWGLLNPTFGLLAGLGSAIVLGVGGALVVRGAISIGSFVAFGFYLGILTWPLISLGWVTNLLQRGDASMGRLNEIFDASPAVVSIPNARELPRTTTGRSLEFRRVGFHYPVRRSPPPDGGNAPDREAPRWVLRDISFSVPAGGTLGVVGATGSGKSALMDLIPRLYDPQEGEIMMDGAPIRDIPLESYRAEIGYVPQESLLFSERIGANIAYGTSSESDTRRAADVAQLTETLAALPSGYDTMLGERGINLSGGQKQRTAIARALAQDPPIVVLDDALSAVDAQTEARILAGLRDALAGRTSVIVSHRLAAVRDADRILVLDRGRIVEEGTHAELVARDGRYWELLRRQQLEEELEENRVGS
ncbi:MAG: ABC transporter ATP-binding protein [Gemmatimonadales bacterium]